MVLSSNIELTSVCSAHNSVCGLVNKGDICVNWYENITYQYSFPLTLMNSDYIDQIPANSDE